jgi:cytochrome c-type biogenesis protein CcmF
VFAILVAGGLVAYRLPELRTTGTIESFFSREAAFLFNNLILVGIAFAVFWGTVFRCCRMGAGREDHRRAAVLQPRERAARGGTPLLDGRRAGDRVAPRDAAEPVAGLRGAGRVRRHGGAPAGRPGHAPRYAHATFALGAFVLGTIAQEFWRGMRRARPS